MQDLIIYDVPDHLFEGLHVRAARHRRSIQDELTALLEVAVAETDGLGLPFNPSPLPNGRTSVRRGWKTVAQDYAETVSRQPVPASTGAQEPAAGVPGAGEEDL